MPTVNQTSIPNGNRFLAGINTGGNSVINPSYNNSNNQTTSLNQGSQSNIPAQTNAPISDFTTGISPLNGLSGLKGWSTPPGSPSGEMGINTVTPQSSTPQTVAPVSFAAATNEPSVNVPTPGDVSSYYNQFYNAMNASNQPTINGINSSVSNLDSTLTGMLNTSLAEGNKNISIDQAIFNQSSGEIQSNVNMAVNSMSANMDAIANIMKQQESATLGSQGAAMNAAGFSQGVGASDPYLAAQKIATQYGYDAQYNALQAATNKDIQSTVLQASQVVANLSGQEMTNITTAFTNEINANKAFGQQIASANLTGASLIAGIQNNTVSSAQALTGTYVTNKVAGENIKATIYGMATQYLTNSGTVGVGAYNAGTQRYGIKAGTTKINLNPIISTVGSTATGQVGATSPLGNSILNGVSGAGQ